MQAELLDTFLDLVATRSFHRSAERLGVTQSTISARLVALEEAVGARLFTRSRAGTMLTTEGLKFETHARGMRHAWTEAQRAVAAMGTAAVSLRIGIQHDLATGAAGDLGAGDLSAGTFGAGVFGTGGGGGHIGTWVAAFRRALPECAFYIEPDYSAQMCTDLARGALDMAVLFTPQTQPDLHIVSLGEVSYRLISSGARHRAGLEANSYIRASFAPAFDAAHAAALPELAGAPLSTGQNAAMVGLLAAMGGAGYVLAGSAAALVAAGGFAYVEDAPPISQPVYGAVHLRHRTSGMHKRLLHIVQRKMAEGGAGGAA